RSVKPSGGRIRDRGGQAVGHRKAPLRAGFAIEAVRALLFALVSDPLLMLAVQLLDGVTGAAVTVLTILVVTSRPARAASIWRRGSSTRSPARGRRPVWARGGCS